MQRIFNTILITGGAGFIGSNLLNLLVVKYPNCHFVNIDKLTYAANLKNLSIAESNNNYSFIKGDIGNYDIILEIFNSYEVEAVIHLAAESHVDRSIENPILFVENNVLASIKFIEIVNKLWKRKNNKLFYYISTDEVFGSLRTFQFSNEHTRYNPSNPYASSKASVEFFLKSYKNTYNLPFLISNSSNNYGQYQYPDKLIPFFINNILNGKTLPIHGSGNYQRDWLWVEDHCRAIDLILHNGKINNSYLVGGNSVYSNIEVADLICNLMDKKMNNNVGTAKNLIEFIPNRKGNDKRYAVNCSKLINSLDWCPSVSFREGLEKTINWYIDNTLWFNCL
jgi:dTDP-glucose 4,6-dehydratase